MAQPFTMPPCCGERWFRTSMALLNSMPGPCGTTPQGNWQVHQPFVHMLAMCVQIFAQRLLLPRNSTWLLLTTVIWNGGLVGSLCPVALHMAKVMQAEILLLSALPAVSQDTPQQVLQQVIGQSILLENEANACLEPYEMLGKELILEGARRLRRFRAYLESPGTWDRPTWSRDADVRLALSWHVSLKDPKGPFSMTLVCLRSRFHH